MIIIIIIIIIIDEAYVINLDDKNSKGTHWMSVLIDRNAFVYFDSLEAEYISLEVLRKPEINQLLAVYLE